MNLSVDFPEIWAQVHYRYRGQSYKYNLPLPRGGKRLDGLDIKFDGEPIAKGQRFLVTMESSEKVDIESFVLTGAFNRDNLNGVFFNGYQSWTESRERSPYVRLSSLGWAGRLLSLNRLGDSSFYHHSERRGRFHGYSYAYLRYPDRLLLLCSLDDSAGYTIIGTDTRRGLFTLSKDMEEYCLKGQKEILNLAILEGSEEEVFDAYSQLRSDSYQDTPHGFGWMGQLPHKRRLDERYIRRNLATCRDKNIPFDYFIIGDGWQSALGEWNLPASGFPSGMSSLCAEIRGSGYTPGLWFAPFVVEPDSTIFRTRKDWLACKPGKSPQVAGRLVQHRGAYFALNLSRQDVREYIAESYQRITKEWKYGFVVLDLLYVAGLYPRDGLSRGGAMNEAMEFLYSLKGDARWLAKGIPLDSSFGKVEYAQVCADSSPRWDPAFFRNIHLRERVSSLNALRSTVGRRHLNGRFISNAVGAFFLKSSWRGMDVLQRYTLLLLNMLLGKFISISDQISNYTDEEMGFFRLIFPLTHPQIESLVETRGVVKICYCIGQRKYINFSNLSARTRTLKLPRGNWFGTSRLGRRAHHIVGLKSQQIKAGESRNYLELQGDDCFAGSDGHIFPGAEIHSIRQEGNNFSVVPKPEKNNPFRIWLQCPFTPNDDGDVTINGVPAEKKSTSSGLQLISALIETASSKNGASLST